MLRKLSIAVLISLMTVFSQSPFFTLAQSEDTELLRRDLEAIYSNTTYYDDLITCSLLPGASEIRPGNVVMVGDTVSVAAANSLTAEFSSGWSLSLNAVEGRQASQANVAISELEGNLPGAESAVVQLGAYDVGSENFERIVLNTVSELRRSNRDIRIFWVNVGSNADGTVDDGSDIDVSDFNSDTPQRYSEINRILEEQALEQGFEVIDWFSEVFPSGDPISVNASLEDANSYLLGDKLTPTSLGGERLASLIYNAITLGGSISDTGARNIQLLPESVPEPYRTLFSEAADRYNTDLAALAATFFIENGRNYPEPPPPYGTGDPWPVSRADARGPWQFIDSTWDAQGVDGNNDGRVDVLDLTDATYAAASHLAEDLGAVRGAPLWRAENLNAAGQVVSYDPGGLTNTNPYDSVDGLNTIVEAWVGYNAGPANVTERRLPLSQETQNYITRAATAYLEYVNAIGVGTANSACQSSEGGIGVAPSGLIFPVITTRQAVIEGTDGLRWCFASLDNCHHDYNAVDIHVETGTDVIATKGGQVVNAYNREGGNGSGIAIKAAPSDGGHVYFYSHLSYGTVTHNVGDIVLAAEKIGEVGTNAEAQGTARHLHFDVLPSTHLNRPSCAGAACSDPRFGFIDVQADMVAAFENLPEAAAGPEPTLGGIQ